nr:putative zinc finger, CCHC-type, retrotransposon Gag domain protein [Tanacetum cinerariifolium]
MAEIVANMNRGTGCAGAGGAGAGGAGAGDARADGDRAGGDGVGGVRSAAPEITWCTYITFIKYEPRPFKGIKGVVGLCHWFEKLESVFRISDCKERDKVKFATATLQGRALTWWNGIGEKVDDRGILLYGLLGTTATLQGRAFLLYGNVQCHEAYDNPLITLSDPHRDDVVVISSDKVKGSGDWNSPEYQDTTGNKGKKVINTLSFYRMEIVEIHERYIVSCFVNGLEAYDGEVNLEFDKNLISNESAVKLCLDYEVKGKRLVKKVLIVSLKGELYFVKLIINPEEDDFKPGVILGRSFLRLANGVFNFAGGHLTQEEAAKEALVIRISQKFALLEEERPTPGTHNKKAGSSRSKHLRQHEIVEEVLLSQVHHEFLLWEGCSRDAKSRGGYDNIQKNDLWLLSMFDARHQNGYEKYSLEDVVRSLSAPIYYRDLDTTTLTDLIDSDGKFIPEDPQPGVPRVSITEPSRASIGSYALSRKPCQEDSLNLSNHRYKRQCCNLIPAKSNSLPHAHAQTTKTYYKHQDSRIKKAQELKTKNFANSDIQDLPLRYQVYQGRLLASFQEDVKYEHVDQEARSQSVKDDQVNNEKI